MWMLQNYIRVGEMFVFIFAGKQDQTKSKTRFWILKSLISVHCAKRGVHHFFK